MIIEEIRKDLLQKEDKKYKDFQGKLIPSIEMETMIGISTPVLRKMAKEYGKNPEIQVFMRDLPHKYFEENQLQAFLISEEKDFFKCVEEIRLFLPYVDNWATCDQMLPKVFKKERAQLLPYIQEWLQAEHPYTVRFAIGLLMQHYLDEEFQPEYLEWIAKIRRDEYYINMMIAWYFATALAKQYEATIPYIKQKSLEQWTHNKSIQKAVESRRISTETKEYLKTLKWK